MKTINDFTQNVFILFYFVYKLKNIRSEHARSLFYKYFTITR